MMYKIQIAEEEKNSGMNYNRMKKKDALNLYSDQLYTVLFWVAVVAAT